MSDIYIPTHGTAQGGGSGKDGTTFYPSVSAEGVISWTNDGGKQNPESVNIKGPRGEQGAQGIQGEQGPKGDKGDKGDTGAQGPAGTNGANGYTPVRGTDYWTNADQIAIINAVLQELPAAESVSA